MRLSNKPQLMATSALNRRAGIYLRLARRRKRMTQDQLGYALQEMLGAKGIWSARVSEWEHGHDHVPAAILMACYEISGVSLQRAMEAELDMESK